MCIQASCLWGTMNLLVKALCIFSLVGLSYVSLSVAICWFKHKAFYEPQELLWSNKSVFVSMIPCFPSFVISSGSCVHVNYDSDRCFMQDSCGCWVKHQDCPSCLFRFSSALYEDKLPICLISLQAIRSLLSFMCSCENQLHLKTKHQDSHSQKPPLKFLKHKWLSLLAPLRALGKTRGNLFPSVLTHESIKLSGCSMWTLFLYLKLIHSKHTHAHTLHRVSLEARVISLVRLDVSGYKCLLICVFSHTASVV